MPRFQKVFKKRKGKYYKRGNTINSKVITTDSKLNAHAGHAHDSFESCAKENKIPNLNESFFSFDESDSIQNAAKEAISENEGNKNIDVAVDGTWQKRGYISLNGVATVIIIDIGKVIDVDFLSKYCTCKNLPFYEKD
ncbi:uncharacterized protein TNIN_57861 [Trichonephila inaurata madagascariensis]|uniref:Mutator-like transposase domain-containing protein n=1 Tax=Trichonephila inaurata madagascariensis TaxID=2747483 RepID=A0A8X6YU40_9ARAC|nr:uncharacterized protein TNIN_57861 [Trichonephila inaurata madagascariensis]